MKKRNKKAYIGTQKKQKIDRKLPTKMPTRYESTVLSPLASRSDTQFNWGFLWLSCGWLAALVANCLGRPAW